MMGTVLQRGDRKLPIGNRIWEVLLIMALRHGWKPVGLEPDKDQGRDPAVIREDWRPHYLQSEGREVGPAEAANIAEALEAALRDIPDDDDSSQPDAHTNVTGLPVSPVELFRGDGKLVVRELIEFCREGAFAIR